MKIEKILFPTEFKELAFNALESLFVLKKAGLKEIVLCYVIPREEVAFVPFGGFLKEEEERIREEARIRFEDWQKAIHEQGIASKVIIETGDPVAEILSIAEREGVQLIAAGKKKITAMERIFMKASLFELIRRSHVPVLVTKYMVQFEWNGEMVTRVNDHIFEKPLLATDWSSPSEKALHFLMPLGSIVKKAAVAHIIDEKLAKGMEKGRMSLIEHESKERLAHYTRMLQEAGVESDYHLSVGQPVLELIRISREHAATMIVMGTTGKDRLQELWFGSVSHRIIEMSELPVLLVP